VAHSAGFEPLPLPFHKHNPLSSMPFDPPSLKDTQSTSIPTSAPSSSIDIDSCPRTPKEAPAPTTAAPETNQHTINSELEDEDHPAFRKIRAARFLCQAAIDGYIDFPTATEGSLAILQAIQHNQAIHPSLEPEAHSNENVSTTGHYYVDDKDTPTLSSSPRIKKIPDSSKEAPTSPLGQGISVAPADLIQNSGKHFQVRQYGGGDKRRTRGP
jgi:hypothetical protein